jgi:hypothetical protein
MKKLGILIGNFWRVGGMALILMIINFFALDITVPVDDENLLPAN